MSEAGVPALGVLQDGRTYFNYHHTAADTLDKMVPNQLHENRRSNGGHGIRIGQHEKPAAQIKSEVWEV